MSGETTAEEFINWEDPVKRGFLEEKGWKWVSPNNTTIFVNRRIDLRTDLMDKIMTEYPPRSYGWIKPPSMKLYSLDEAFDKELTCQDQE